MTLKEQKLMRLREATRKTDEQIAQEIRERAEKEIEKRLKEKHENTKKAKRLGLTLEQYLEYNSIKKTLDNYKNDRSRARRYLETQEEKVKNYENKLEEFEKKYLTK